MKIRELYKDLVGAVIYVVPTGNAARKGLHIKEAFVKSVATKYAVLVIGDCHKKVSLTGAHIPLCNSGFLMYSSPEEAKVDYLANKVRPVLLEALMYRETSSETVLEVAKVLGIDAEAVCKL